MLCFFCKTQINEKHVPYHDLEMNITLHFHTSCWFGEVRRKVVEEYLLLIRRLTKGTYGRRLKR